MSRLQQVVAVRLEDPFVDVERYVSPSSSEGALASRA